jgi:hypothetical protein
VSVLETDLIDYIYLDDQDETPVLVVSDPLTWRPPEDQRHLDMLRDKLNAQITFIETGQIKSVWPKYDGRPVRVEVVARCPLTDAANHFYVVARKVMTEANMELRFQLLDA